MMQIPITLTVNGRPYALEVRPNELLLNVLRDRLGLMGAKYGCGIGECGACTVLLDGKAVLSCQMLAFTADGGQIRTVEGLEQDGSLDPLQEAFVEEGAIQCGYCTPAMLLSAKALLDEHPDPTEDQIRDAIRGNLCRCTGYVNIIRAIQVGARKLKTRADQAGKTKERISP
ncbi:MAG: (2Fe-2S)-binding protein [Spirochaetales bacterium]|nr:(2Fe-2S)-binding protein [Spirochaetales bacterium]